ncbi:coiled-coil domain-containing protein 24 [Pristis pectinata]|uniref:coiled-coil domain-containing protein 24 n=1 Tax=Pristis pectinata TaxID=685728 RepID=UPI00223D1EDF|nr:coiled-coil domain-containing protein 24 [Pristis pectinata]XP_051868857.1 coiled-coil domain-containing protein 24 [Pristis pectinata]XP_051868858.1 coiled-coil domain-containing protein 24 [Pristis pectinata]XP_051868859.1 coiled-coil domain-containing protein 24 [Pristis pectinata]
MSLKFEDEDRFTNNYEQPLSLWKLIEECVPPCERDEIRVILGESAVDLTLDLHAEVAMLLEIWRSMKTSRLTPSHSQASHAVLPESPAIKDLLRHEIQLLLLNIQNKAHKEGRDESDALSSYNHDVVSFALGQNKAAYTPSRSVNAESMKDKWMVLQSSQTTNNFENESFSSLSHLKDNVEAVKDKVNVTNIDKIVAHLQSILQEESKILEKYIQFLQECLEEEHNCSLDPKMQTAVPSIAELREERKILERDLQLATPSVQSLVQVHKLYGCRSSQRSCRRTVRLNNPAVNPSEGGHSSTVTSGQSEPDLEQRMKQHSTSPLGESGASGMKDSSTKLKYSGIFTTSSQRFSCRTMDLSKPTYHSKGASTTCLASKGACSPVACSEVKTQSKTQPQKMDDKSRALSANKIESACERTFIEESPSFQEEGQKALVYSQSANGFLMGQQSIVSSTQTGVHCTTENNRTLLSSLRSPVEVLSSIPQQDGHILNPAPPTTEKPIGTQGKSTHRLRRACRDSLTGHT